MKKNEVCALIREIGVIPAVKVSSTAEAHFAADCVCSGGIPIVEISMVVSDAVKLISHITGHHKKVLVGAGTVLDIETAQECLDAGAAFLTAPSFDSPVVEFAAQHEIAVLPGALTPTEVVAAWKAGADFVKVFPCSSVAGDKHIKSLKATLPQIPLVAAGGVTQQAAASFILAGAAAIGVGDELLPPDAIEHREAERIQELARRFLHFVKDARRRLPAQKENVAEDTADFWKLHRHSRKP